MYIDAGVA